MPRHPHPKDNHTDQAIQSAKDKNLRAPRRPLSPFVGVPDRHLACTPRSATTGLSMRALRLLLRGPMFSMSEVTSCPRVLTGAGCAGVPMDELWTTAGVLTITAGAVITAVGLAGVMLCAGVVSMGTDVSVERGAASSTFQEAW